ncbi:hypothetical protein [Methanoregula sp.]|jgi:hypothetical protein|uniref:hypothetical protein n=1 Tax=Methanoregula sp. TaxID=2052170 RepID=UPI003C18C8CF
MVIIMGSQKDVMALFAERDIRQLFSGNDGWKIEPVLQSAGSYYRISRDKWVGEEVVLVAVSFDPAPTDDIFAAFDNQPDGWSTRTKKYLLTPQATNTSAIPPHIRVLLMQAFAFAQGELVWLTNKKNAKKVVPQEQTKKEPVVA